MLSTKEGRGTSFVYFAGLAPAQKKLKLEHRPCFQQYTDFSVFSVFFIRFSVFFGISKTDVGIGIGFLKYRDIGSVFGIPTQD